MVWGTSATGANSPSFMFLNYLPYCNSIYKQYKRCVDGTYMWKEENNLGEAIASHNNRRVILTEAEGGKDQAQPKRRGRGTSLGENRGKSNRGRTVQQGSASQSGVPSNFCIHGRTVY